MAQTRSMTNGDNPFGHSRNSSYPDSEGNHSKKLIVCCDGTWMDSDNGYVKGKGGRRGHVQFPSNVTRIARAITAEDDNHHPQIVYYQSGIGTGIGLYSHLVGGGTGVGLEENIRESYAFLANNYRAGDDKRLHPNPDSIFLVGFSRGAFTARSIGGLLGAVGLLKKKYMAHFIEVFMDWENAGNPNHTPLFFDSYCEQTGTEQKEKYKPKDSLAHDKMQIDTYMQEYFKGLDALGVTQAVDVKCIGVWDTVGALGIPVNPVVQRLLPFLPGFVHEYSWFDTRLDSHIKNAFHALALDERRYPFSPSLWEKDPNSTTNMKQVWFPGAHSNVGGSYADAGMADITLAWMMDQLSGNTMDDYEKSFDPLDWIKFDDDYLSYSANPVLPEKVKTTKDVNDYKRWAMGYVYDTVYFPTSLTGTMVRGPGQYHRTSYQTGKPDPKQLLLDTQERIHSCVRARIDLGGRCVEPDYNQFFPNSLNILPWVSYFWRWMTGRLQAPYRPHFKGGPLEGFKLVDGHKSHDKPNNEIDVTPDGQSRVYWEYTGSARCGYKQMPEEKLGEYERRLLEKKKADQQLAEQILFSNNSFKKPKKRTKGPAKHGQTWTV